MLNWLDNFADPPGSPPDPKHWTCTTNQQGGGNSEAQYYVPQNVLTSAQGLVLKATADTGTYQAWDGPSKVLSGKAWTNRKLAWRYGHLAVNATFPTLPGSWPAIWMLGQNYDDVGWPECGEIDIMEWFGARGNPQVVSGALHSATDNIAQDYTVPTPMPTVAHTYTLDWRPTSLAWGVDGTNFLTVTKAQLRSWPFDNPFFLILNLAIGGTMGGAVPPPSGLPMQMTVHSVSLSNAEVITA